MRILTFPVCLALAGLVFAGCYTSHEVDERRIQPLSPQEEVPAPNPNPAPKADAGVPQAPEDAGNSADDCAEISDPIQRILCSLGGTGGLPDLIEDLLGGGGNPMDCSEETDPIARLLCSITSGSGTGLEGLLGDLLGGGGGGLLGDAGLSGVLSDAFAQVIRGIIDDLIQGLFDGLRSRSGDGGTFSGIGSRGRQLSARVNAEAIDPATLPEPTDAECAEVHPEDLLTRLLCVRRALDVLEAQAAADIE